MMNPVVSLILSLLVLQYITSTLATKSFSAHQNQNSKRSAYASPILLNIRTVSSEFSAPLDRPSFDDQSTYRKRLCGENSVLQGYAADAKLGENIAGIIECNVDRESRLRMDKPSSVIASDGSTIANGDTLKRFRQRRSLQRHRHSFPSSRQATDTDIYIDKSTVSGNFGRDPSENSARKGVKLQQTRTKRETFFKTTDGKVREKKPFSRKSFANLNPWSRHLVHFHGLQQKSLGRERRRSGGFSPAWKKRAWEDIDMPAWGKRLAGDDDSHERRASRTIEKSPAEPQERSRLESLSYDDSDNFQPEGLTGENLGWEKKDWEDIDMHAWGKRATARDIYIQPLDNINADITAH